MSKLTPTQIKEEFEKLKIPSFIIFAEKFWFKFGRYFTFFGMISYFPIGIIINSTNNPQTKFILSQIAIYLFVVLLVGFGGLMLVSHFVEKAFVKKHSKRLGLTLDEWNDYAEEFDFKSF